MDQNPKKQKKVNYDKWGYLFIAPFFLIYAVFSFFPLLSTFYNSVFENYMSGLTQIGPHFVGLENFKAVFANAGLLRYFGNTMLMWVVGFVPQILVSLVLAYWFSNHRLKVKGQRFFKTVIYMPNLIMASAFSMLFFALFSANGPVNDILVDVHITKEPIRFFTMIWGTRGLVGLMNFMMWFGNTTILLMASMLGVDPGLYEAAEIDGATSVQVFFKITLPMIRPILLYVLMTSLMGGLQMFDVPQILTNGAGGPDSHSMTLIMYLNKHLFSKNYGMAGAVSVILFVITMMISLIVYFSMTDRPQGRKKK